MLAAGSPLTMNGLRLSKVPSTPCTSWPPLRRGRVGIGRMVEIGTPGRLAMHGDGVMRAAAARRRAASQQAARARRATTVRRDARNRRQRGGAANRARARSDAIRFRFCIIYHRAGSRLAAPIFGAFVALLQAQYRLSGSLKCHAPAVFPTGESRV